MSCWSHPEHDLLKQSQCVNDPGDDPIVGAIESNVDEIKKIIELITNDKFYGLHPVQFVELTLQNIMS